MTNLATARSVKPCTYPGCGTLVVNGRCAKHPYPDRSGPTNPKYLTSAWRALRAQKLRASPLCEEHFGSGFVVGAQCVDHRDGDSENDAWENLRSLCTSCHSVKTATQDGGFGNKPGKGRAPTGLDGWPMATPKDA